MAGGTYVKIWEIHPINGSFNRSINGRLSNAMFHYQRVLELEKDTGGNRFKLVKQDVARCWKFTWLGS